MKLRDCRVYLNLMGGFMSSVFENSVYDFQSSSALGVSIPNTEIHLTELRSEVSHQDNNNC